MNYNKEILNENYYSPKERLQVVANFLNMFLSHYSQEHYSVKHVYLDFGAGIMWDTIVATTLNPIGSCLDEYQLLAPNEHEVIISGDMNQIIKLLKTLYEKGFVRTIKKELINTIQLLREFIKSNNLDSIDELLFKSYLNCFINIYDELSTHNINWKIINSKLFNCFRKEHYYVEINSSDDSKTLSDDVLSFIKQSLEKTNKLIQK